MSRKCYIIVASEGRLSKRRAQDRKRARERRALETAAQREVRLVKCRLRCVCFFLTEERGLSSLPAQ